MAKKEKFVFQDLETESAQIESKNIQGGSPAAVEKLLANLQQNQAGGSKVTFDCPPELLERLKDYGYWEGLSMRDIIIEAVNVFLDSKTFKTRPDKVKNKKKVGRKPKALKLIQQVLG